MQWCILANFNRGSSNMEIMTEAPTLHHIPTLIDEPNRASPHPHFMRT